MALGDDVVAGRAQREHHRGEGPHARGRRPAPPRRPRARRSASSNALTVGLRVAAVEAVGAGRRGHARARPVDLRAARRDEHRRGPGRRGSGRCVMPPCRHGPAGRPRSASTGLLVVSSRRVDRGLVVSSLLHLVEERRRSAPTWSRSSRKRRGRGASRSRRSSAGVPWPAQQLRGSAAAGRWGRAGRSRCRWTSVGTLIRAMADSRPPPSAADVVQVHGLRQQQVAVGVEAPDELVAVVVEVALDLEALPQVEARRARGRPARGRTGR